MPVALHCVGARHPIVYVALVVRVRAACARTSPCGGSPVRPSRDRVRASRQAGLRKQRRKYAAGPPSSGHVNIGSSWHASRDHGRCHVDISATPLSDSTIASTEIRRRSKRGRPVVRSRHAPAMSGSAGQRSRSRRLRCADDKVLNKAPLRAVDPTQKTLSSEPVSRPTTRHVALTGDARGAVSTRSTRSSHAAPSLEATRSSHTASASCSRRNLLCRGRACCCRS